LIETDKYRPELHLCNLAWWLPNWCTKMSTQFPVDRSMLLFLCSDQWV